MSKGFKPLCYTNDGVTLTYKEWAERLGISVNTFGERVRLGRSKEKIFTPGLLQGQAYEYKGELLTIAELAKKYKVKDALFRKRLWTGWTVERALNQPIEEKMKTLTYADQTKAIASWAREYGLLPKTLLNRINRGWSIQNALQTPTQKRVSKTPKLSKVKRELLMSGIQEPINTNASVRMHDLKGCE